MWPFSTRAWPKPSSSTSIALSVASSRASSRVVTIAPALPSAGCVWVPKVTVPSGLTGFSLASPSAVVANMPSSPSSDAGLLAETGVGERHVLHVAPLERAVVGQRVLVLLVAPQHDLVHARRCRRRSGARRSRRCRSSRSSRSGSWPKLSMHPASRCDRCRRARSGPGSRRWGPFEQRSAVTTRAQVGAAERDLLRRHLQRAGAGGAGLLHGRARRPGPGRACRSATAGRRTRRLRVRDAEDAEVDRARASTLRSSSMRRAQWAASRMLFRWAIEPCHLANGVDQ